MGTIPLVLEQRAFEEGYAHGRRYYFEDAWEEQEKEGMKEALAASHLLGLVAVRDERGCYRLDDGRDKGAFRTGVEELLGVLGATFPVPCILQRQRSALSEHQNAF